MSIKYSEDVTNRVVESIVERLGTDIIAIYGMGSIGYGGFVPNWSDYDIDVIIKENNHEDFIKIMDDIESSLEKEGYIDIDVKCYKLSQLNGENKSIYTYGLTNRLIMINNSAKLLYGEDITEKLNVANSKDIRIETKTVLGNLLSQTDQWWKERPIDDTAALLALPARLIYTLEFKDVTNKSIALDYFMDKYKESIPDSIWIWLVWSRGCRDFESSRNIPYSLKPIAIEAARYQLLLLQQTLGGGKND